MNIMILSAGTRNKIVQFYKEALRERDKITGEKSLIIATDCSPYAPALYDADVAEIVPPMTAEGYFGTVLDLVKKHEVRGLFSLIDPELSLVAKHADELRALSCEPLISPYEVVETAFHKARMCELFSRKGLKTPRYVLSVEEFLEKERTGEMSYPVFIKPENGSASIDIHMANTEEELRVIAGGQKVPMIQEMMTGQEYGADAYVDLISGKCVSIFLKKKIKMRAGETDKAVSVHDEEAFAQIARFVEETGFRGQLDLDLFYQNGEWVFSEVNPRYGGGYPHAQACGVNMPALYLNNLAGKENDVNIGAYDDDVYMMKYNEIMIRGKENLA